MQIYARNWEKQQRIKFFSEKLEQDGLDAIPVQAAHVSGGINSLLKLKDDVAPVDLSVGRLAEVGQAACRVPPQRALVVRLGGQGVEAVGIDADSVGLRSSTCDIIPRVSQCHELCRTFGYLTVSGQGLHLLGELVAEANHRPKESSRICTDRIEANPSDALD